MRTFVFSTPLPYSLMIALYASLTHIFRRSSLPIVRPIKKSKRALRLTPETHKPRLNLDIAEKATLTTKKKSPIVAIKRKQNAVAWM